MEAFLASLYFFGGFAYVASPPSLPQNRFYVYDRNIVHNPYGIIGLGLEHEFNSRLSIHFEAQHESSIPTSQDSGSDSARLYLKWKVFK